MKPKKQRHWIPFVDNKGIVRLTLHDTLTLAELTRRGIKLDMVPKDLPIPDGHIVHNPAHYPKE